MKLSRLDDVKCPILIQYLSFMTSDASQAGEDNGRVGLRGGQTKERLPLVRRQGEHLTNLLERDVHCTRDSSIRGQLLRLKRQL